MAMTSWCPYCKRRHAPGAAHVERPAVAETLRALLGEQRRPTEADLPPVSTFRGGWRRPPLEGQLELEDGLAGEPEEKTAS